LLRGERKRRTRRVGSGVFSYASKCHTQQFNSAITKNKREVREYHGSYYTIPKTIGLCEAADGTLGVSYNVLVRVPNLGEAGMRSAAVRGRLQREKRLPRYSQQPRLDPSR